MNRSMMTLTVLCLLTSCASLMPPKIAPEPPRLDCAERAAAEPLPRRPKFGPLPGLDASRKAWLSYIGRIHALWGADRIRVIGWGESILTQRAETADCIDRERAAGRIR